MLNNNKAFKRSQQARMNGKIYNFVCAQKTKFTKT